MPSGLIVPTQGTPHGYIKLRRAVDGSPLIVSAAFVVAVMCGDDVTYVQTTTSDESIEVREAFDTVMRLLCEVLG